MSLLVAFRNNDYSLAIPLRLKYSVSDLQWQAVGGPYSATIEVQGGESSLWRLVNLLRHPVDILDRTGFCWWGYVHSVTLHLPDGEITFSLEQMVNKVAVAYTFVGTGTKTSGISKTTPWSSDSNSQALFGIKELKASNSIPINDAAALARRSQILTKYSRPQGVKGQMAGNLAETTATINCLGWWSILGWRYADVPPVINISYEALGAATQDVGGGNSNSKVLQQFTVGAADIHAIQAAVRVNKVGSPTDDLSFGIYALDGSGHPTDSPLVSGSVSGLLLSSSPAWVTMIGSEAVLSANTMYGLQINRSGSVDGSNYYQVNVNTSLGYAGGAFKVYNTSSWVSRSPDADMTFKIYINEQKTTTEQVSSLITTFGQVFSGVIIEADSLISQGSYMAGDVSALQAIEELLSEGGANGRPMATRVTRERTVYLREETLPTAARFAVDRKGRFYSQAGTRLWNLYPPVGEWVRVKDAPQSLHGIVDQDSVLYQFLEGADWSPENGLQPQYRGLPGAEDLLKMRR